MNFLSLFGIILFANTPAFSQSVDPSVIQQSEVKDIESFTRRNERKEESLSICTMEFDPICGQPPMSGCHSKSNCTQDMPPPRTYGNRCQLEADGANFLHAGKCHETEKKKREIPSNCKRWFDGCNTCSRGKKEGPTICTLRACMQYSQSKCLDFFDTDDGDSEESFPYPKQNFINCQVTFDGCNACVQDRLGNLECTNKHCEILQSRTRKKTCVLHFENSKLDQKKNEKPSFREEEFPRRKVEKRTQKYYP
jgi:hypothetical protein